MLNTWTKMPNLILKVC